MTIKPWRNSWTTPGQSEQLRPILDARVGRDLLVMRNAHIRGDLVVDGKFGPVWTPYTSTMTGNQLQQGTGNPATGMVYTAIARYSVFGKTVSFYVHINVTNSANMFSNPFVDLPPGYPPNYQIDGTGFYRQTGNTLLTSIFATSGYAKAGDTKIFVFASQNTNYVLHLLAGL
jgi:hypothetical protein